MSTYECLSLKAPGRQAAMFLMIAPQAVDKLVATKGQLSVALHIFGAPKHVCTASNISVGLDSG